MNQSFSMSYCKDRTEDETSDFSILINEHAAKGFHFAYRLTGNEQNARDLMQQTLMKALTHFGKYERTRPFAPWFNQILKNIFLDGVRRVEHKRTVSLDGPSPMEDITWEQLMAGSDHTPLEYLEKMELNVLARKALSMLPAPYKVAVTLCDVERFSYQRIAEMLECPVGTVRSRIHYGRTLLRESFERIAARA